MKESWKPGTMIYPLPAVLVGCGDAPDNWNLLTVAWTGPVCPAPPMCYVSVRPERHSHALIARTGEFTINLTTAAMARAVDWCGVRSGRDYDKFRETGLTPLRGAAVAAPGLGGAAGGRSCRSGRTTCFWRRSSTCWSMTATLIPPRGVSIWNERGWWPIRTANISGWAS